MGSQAPDSGGAGASPPALLVETDELRSAGNRLLEQADVLGQAQSAAMCASTSEWGSADAAAAGTRFADRFTHLLGALSDEVDAAGHELRLSAEGYDWVDATVAQTMTSTEGSW